jgi:hypothetical protein
LGLQTEEDLQREVIYFSTICDFCETRGGWKSILMCRAVLRQSHGMHSP